MKVFTIALVAGKLANSGHHYIETFLSNLVTEQKMHFSFSQVNV